MGQQREFERKPNKKWVKYLVWEWGICTFDTTYERQKNIRSQHRLSCQFCFPSRWCPASSRAQSTKYDRTRSYINRLFLYKKYIYFSTIHTKSDIFKSSFRMRPKFSTSIRSYLTNSGTFGGKYQKFVYNQKKADFRQACASQYYKDHKIREAGSRTSIRLQAAALLFNGKMPTNSDFIVSLFLFSSYS